MPTQPTIADVYDLFATRADASGSVAAYLVAQIDEYRCQAYAAHSAHTRACERGESSAAKARHEAAHDVAAAKRDAYTDALRVLDIATDALFNRCAVL